MGCGRLSVRSPRLVTTHRRQCRAPTRRCPRRLPCRALATVIVFTGAHRWARTALAERKPVTTPRLLATTRSAAPVARRSNRQGSRWSASSTRLRWAQASEPGRGRAVAPRRRARRGYDVMKWFAQWQRAQQVVDAGFRTPDGKRPPYRTRSLAYAAQLALTRPVRRLLRRWQCAACGQRLPHNLEDHHCPLDRT
jgi:hypothetical protein